MSALAAELTKEDGIHHKMTVHQNSVTRNISDAVVVFIVAG